MGNLNMQPNILGHDTNTTVVIYVERVFNEFHRYT